ncbi:hypothetical protein LCGC14_1407500 [marine sediment metagenome]|uniref:Uncharacterized protein n=1 Tax=marine sediment metagenome TaxID=412755 RepID=A0A0F9MAJ3_9ZZZZ
MSPGVNAKANIEFIPLISAMGVSPWVSTDVHDMNFRLGPDPNNRTDVASSSLIKVIKKYWGRNTIRPSNATFAQPLGFAEK